jgi:hypothetical protein
LKLIEDIEDNQIFGVGGRKIKNDFQNEKEEGAGRT